MAYLEQTDNELIPDIITRKEFYWLKRWPLDKSNKYSDIIPRFLLEDSINRSGNLRLLSYQRFIQNYMNPNTPYKRILMKWQTGTGKSIGALSIAMNFIQNYRLEKEIGHIEIGSVFIIGFSERVFKNELLRFPEFGFLTKAERHRLNKLKRIASTGSKHDIDRYHDMITKIKKRFSNRKGNGFFKFYGYKAFVNRIFKTSPDTVLNNLNEEQIREAIVQGKITYNEELLSQFKNSLIICDEIHNVYNSVEKNNWGVAIQSVLDNMSTCRAVYASATPLNNSPTEIVDLLNLLLPSEQRLIKSDFFTSDKELKPGALNKIAQLSQGRVSYLRDVNPKYYPRIKMYGEILKEIPYLKFIRCPMSSFHYNTYKQVYTGTLSQDSQYLVDFALENPNPEQAEKNIGVFQTNTVKTGITNAPAKWKEKYGFQFKNNRIMGDALIRDRLVKYSSKYVRMLDELKNVIEQNRGKVFIYHNIVHMSGVLFIEQVLKKNGYIDEFSGANDNTICIKCGQIRKKHTKSEIYGSNESMDTTNSKDPEIVLEKHDDTLTWKQLDDNIMTIKKQANPDRYIILANSLCTDLVKGKSDLLRTLSHIVGQLENIPICVQVPNYAPRLGEWFLHIGFKIKKQTNKYVVMTLPPNDKDSVHGGRIKESPSKTSIRIKSRHIDTKSSHKFTPVRFIIAHSEIDKAQMEHSLEKFDNPVNADGSRYMILIGSKIMKESHDIKAIQNIFIMGRPDNIPTLLQIRGRAIRKNSHRDLPIENREVGIYIFTSCLPVKQTAGPDKGKYKLSYEEEKYRDKAESFKITQLIEKTLHENAIDSLINFDLINRETVSEIDPLDALPFKPNINSKYFKELKESQLKTSTFSIYHAKKEVGSIRSMIKRFFIELSSVWEYSDLFDAIKTDPLTYEPELNTRLFTEKYYTIALDQLSWNNDQYYTEPLISKYTQIDEEIHDDTHSGTVVNSKYNTHSTQYPDYIVDKLYDTNDKIITLPGGQDSIIMPIADGSKQYYILFPIDVNNNEPNIDLELPYRISKQEINNTINMNSFIQTKRINFDYDDKKDIFYRKYIDISIENMENVVCEYGTNFHIKFLEECVEYVFGVWTDPKLKMHKYHEFYFKMIYYYDLLSLVMWAYTSKPRIFKAYAKYAVPVKAKDIKLKAMAKYEKRQKELDDISPDDTSDLAESGVINLLKSSINRTSNVWIPREFRDQFNETVNDSFKLFDGYKKKNKNINKVSARLLPIGHYIGKFPKIYHPENGWDEDPTYVQHDQEYIENDTIVGYDEKSKTGVHVRFKIRSPIHIIKKHKDSRLIEKGTVCKSKSKTYLRYIIKKLDITVPEKINVEEICVFIRSKLIRLELKERIKKSKIKYFYFHYESQMPI
jgi:hypothetical protein